MTEIVFKYFKTRAEAIDAVSSYPDAFFYIMERIPSGIPEVIATNDPELLSCEYVWRLETQYRIGHS